MNGRLQFTMPQGVEDKHIQEEDIPQTTALPVGPE
jgi:hypothetical protein